MIRTRSSLDQSRSSCGPAFSALSGQSWKLGDGSSALAGGRQWKTVASVQPSVHEVEALVAQPRERVVRAPVGEQGQNCSEPWRIRRVAADVEEAFLGSKSDCSTGHGARTRRAAADDVAEHRSMAFLSGRMFVRPELLRVPLDGKTSVAVNPV